MNIPHEEWQEAAGGLVQDAQGHLWRIVGFIDRPAVLLNPVTTQEEVDRAEPPRPQMTVIMGSPVSEEYTRLVPYRPRDAA